ncbi:trimethylamine methyltransferase family protein, partial [Candidatus Thioglobus sp.]|nr:trimethylamine methyltransferase family protein [Candidatus Thioglobus sp.]
SAVYGNFLTTMDLKSGAPTFGTAESSLATYAVGQMARRVGLPFRAGGHYTASKVADAQAMQESVDSIYPAILAGANFIQLFFDQQFLLTVHPLSFCADDLTYKSYDKFRI